MRRLSLLLVAGITAIALTACSGTSSPSASSPAGAPPSTAASPGTSAAAACSVAAAGATAAVNVTVKDFKFSPDPVQAKVGDVITWTNNDSVPHSATLEDGTCSTDTIAAGTTGSLVFSIAGTYTYKCKIHPTQMKGFKIVVT